MHFCSTSGPQGFEIVQEVQGGVKPVDRVKRVGCCIMLEGVKRSGFPK
jgi:hypothetical protein